MSAELEMYVAEIHYKDGSSERISLYAEDLDEADFLVGGMVAFNPNLDYYEVDLEGDD